MVSLVLTVCSNLEALRSTRIRTEPIIVTQFSEVGASRDLLPSVRLQAE
jgi:hypothetical protein